MKRLLLTGFMPFGGESINPSAEAVLRLPDAISEYSIDKLILPVVFGEAAEKVIRAASNAAYDVILCIGQAGGRAEICPELVGINLRYATIPDNGGNMPKDEPIYENGKNAYFSTIPVRKISEKISGIGIPSRVSYSAGAYVCNDLLYTLLSHFDGSKTKVGFIHIPYSKEQGKEPAMELSDVIRALNVAIENLE